MLQNILNAPNRCIHGSCHEKKLENEEFFKKVKSFLNCPKLYK